MSRKTLLAVLGVISVVLTFLQEQFGLSMDVPGVMGGLTVVMLYILFEAKEDIKRIAPQVGRFKDPKFWIAFVAVLLGSLNEQLGLNLPVEAIVSVLTLIMAVLFKVSFDSSTK